MAILKFILLTAALLACAASWAKTPVALQGVGWDQRLGAQLPLEEKFRDENGNAVALRDYFHGSKPVILTLAYYECPNLCTLVLNGLTDAIPRLPSRKMGSDYEVVTLSIDPSEKPRLALMKQRTYLARLGRTSNPGWHFLTGEAPAIARVAREAGFGYHYDPVERQYSHPSGLIVLSSDGRARQYLTGIRFKPQALEEALKRAELRQNGSVLEQVLLFCFHYDPASSPHGPEIMGLIRILAAFCAIGFLTWLARSIRAGLQT
jgi:protein SCO1/2